MRFGHTLALIGVLIVFLIFFFFSQKNEIVNYPPKDGTVVAFGDSLVKGVGAAEDLGFISVLQGKIGEEIVNLGVPGDTTRDGLARIEEVRVLEPRIVILLLGGNDYLQKIPKEETFTNLKTIIKTLQQDGTLVVLLGVRGGLLTDGYDEAFDDLASESGVVFVPDILDGVFGKASLMSDAVHPNAAGYALIAERVYEAIKGVLR